MKNLVRVFLFVGAVALVSGQSGVGGWAGRLLASEPNQAVGSIAAAASDFGVDLYGQLSRENPGKNLFFSPASVSLAMAMTAAGAKGQTETEMVRALHLGNLLANGSQGRQ